MTELEVGDLVMKEELYGSSIYYGIVVEVSWDWRGPIQTIFSDEAYWVQSRRSMNYWKKV